MRIGLNGGAGSIEKMVEQAQRAEADGFSALWYPSAVAGDPVTPMAVCGRATASIDLLDAGATDIWAAIFPVGDDGGASRRRTRALLQELVAAG